MKRILICGDREWTNESLMRQEIRRFSDMFGPFLLVHGAARGADTMAGAICEEMGFPVEAYPADWKRYGRAAGPIRNQQMLDTGPDFVLAFHGHLNESKGTKHMVEIARKASVTTMIFGDDTYDNQLPLWWEEIPI